MKYYLLFTILSFLFSCTSEKKEVKSNSENLDLSKDNTIKPNKVKEGKCSIDFELINDSIYNHHLAIYRILNGQDDDTVVNGKLFTMFLYSLYPDEDKNHFNLTNRVVHDLLSAADTLCKFHLDSKQFRNYHYLTDHLKQPKCFNGTLDEYTFLIKNKVVAKTDSTERIKQCIIEQGRTFYNTVYSK